MKTQQISKEIPEQTISPFGKGDRKKNNAFWEERGVESRFEFVLIIVDTGELEFRNKQNPSSDHEIS